jgi:hypothetical protein
VHPLQEPGTDLGAARHRTQGLESRGQGAVTCVLFYLFIYLFIQKYLIVSINPSNLYLQVDATQNPILKKRFDIKGYPTLILYLPTPTCFIFIFTILFL